MGTAATGVGANNGFAMDNQGANGMSLHVVRGLSGYVRRHWAQAGNSCLAGAGEATAAGAGVGAGPGPAVIALGFRL